MTASAVPVKKEYDARANGTELSVGWEMFVFALAILSITNMILVFFARLDQVGQVITVVDITISIIFLADFTTRMRKATDSRLYFVRGLGWLDLISCVPFLRFARIIRIVRVIRKLRAEGGMDKMLHDLGAARASSSLLLVVFIAILVWEFGSVAILSVESRSADGNIKTASDALWYALVTMSTVGYGDRFPVTDLGRLIGSVIIIVGVGLFGTLTGFLANAFLAPRTPKPAEDPAQSSEATIDAVAAGSDDSADAATAPNPAPVPPN
jgi:voltage-gated potassium channel